MVRAERCHYAVMTWSASSTSRQGGAASAGRAGHNARIIRGTGNFEPPYPVGGAAGTRAAAVAAGGPLECGNRRNSPCLRPAPLPLSLGGLLQAVDCSPLSNVKVV